MKPNTYCVIFVAKTVKCYILSIFEHNRGYAPILYDAV